ncbi:thioredoxin [Planctomicrobium piriforme]|uniref:Thioredoxin n=1 Tax=Planctomicrobium piriforme TaxID=1576369 RepID=A0A1I3Q2I8_9PLAN|nr:thioredoxin [Planctomicrobium piriforme]SFJ27677.1 thioredoxin 1 [Planctomicrobium piriforme]
MAGNLKEFNDGTFQDEVLSSDQPVLVDFWAPWCGPCKMLTPTIEALAEKYAGKVKIGKLNTDDNRQAAINYQINSIPTLIVFKGGKPVDRILGLQPQDRIAQLLDKHVG